MSGTTRGGPLSTLNAIVLGTVEGVTEFLPVSSTGHLLVTQRILGIGSAPGAAAADTYAVVIQFGAILAIVTLYWRRLVQVLRGVIGHDPRERRLGVALVTAFLPAAVIGIVAGDTIKSRLFGPWPVVAAWIVGGAVLLGWRTRRHGAPLSSLGPQSAALIGSAQVLALWPGTSRSLVTILAAGLVGLSLDAAVEFSFLLGVLTLGAATGLDLVRNGSVLLDNFGWQTPLLGVLVAWVTATIAIRAMLTILKTRSLSTFGWYRLGAASVTAVLLLNHTIA